MVPNNNNKVYFTSPIRPIHSRYTAYEEDGFGRRHEMVPINMVHAVGFVGQAGNAPFQY
jgi:hypothetical protein